MTVCLSTLCLERVVIVKSVVKYVDTFLTAIKWVANGEK